jgi:hypothetical protein
MTRCIPVAPLFSRQGLRLARQIIEQRKSDHRIVAQLERELIMPIIGRIELRTGLDMYAPYLAWRLLHELRGVS